MVRTRRSPGPAISVLAAAMLCTCAAEDPCAGVTAAACLDVTLLGGERLDSVELDMRGALRERYRWPPFGSFTATPPLRFAVPLTRTGTGELRIMAVASLGEETVALGKGTTALMPGAGTAVSITLEPIDGASCSDGVQDGAESDVDCGGGCGRCGDGKGCRVRGDCASDVCTQGTCVSAACSDRVLNGSETDLDCGGGACLRCVIGRACKVGTDCTSGVCRAGRCEAPSCSDGTQNGSESDRDCGGVCEARCAEGAGCLADSDCQSRLCRDEVCAAAPAILSAEPPAASNAGGATLTINGRGFPAAAPTLTVDGVPAGPVTRVSGTQVTAVVPERPGRGGPVDLVLRFPGLPPAVGKGVFRYALASLEFAPRASYPIGGASRGVALGDVDGNGTVDAAAPASDGNRVAVLYGAGNGSFLGRRDFATGGSAPVQAALADVDGDGYADLLAANEGSGNIAVLLNDPMSPGSFQAARLVSCGAAPAALAVGKITGGDRPDIVVVNRNDSRVTVLKNDGAGAFTALGDPTSTGAGTAPAALAIADLNKDMKLDVVTANGGNGTLSVLLGNGDGTFQAAASYAAGPGPTAVQLADLDGDGALDAVVAASGAAALLVLPGQGDGALKAPASYTTGGAPSGLALADFNLDGFIDLLTPNRNDNSVGLLLGKRGGAFEAQQSFPVGRAPQAVGAGDLDSDGRPDLVVLNAGDGTVSVRRNISR